MNLLARTFLNHKIKSYGVMTRLEIDSMKKSLRLDLELKGESAPILIEVGSYSLEEQDGKTILTLHNIRTSREWLTVVANDYLINRRITIPKAAAMAL